MSLARAVFHVTAWTAAIYLGLWIVAALLWPVTPPDQALDAWKGYNSVYGSDVREVVYSLPAHCDAAPKKRLIILGSSSAQAYRPEILRAATHFDEVDNLEVGGSNITQIRQLVTDIKRCFGEQTLRSTTFLFVTSYILFVDDNRRWTTDFTIYEAEKIRHGLYSGSPNALKPAFQPSIMLWAIDALRPVFALYHLEGIGRGLAIRLVRAAWTHPTVDKEYRKLVARKFPTKTDPATFGAEQFRQLDGLVADIRASGAELVFVQQPAESFERQKSQIYADYLARFSAFTSKHSIPVIDLSASASDSEFLNPLHARDASWDLWTRRLADKLPSDVVLAHRPAGARAVAFVKSGTSGDGR